MTGFGDDPTGASPSPLAEPPGFGTDPTGELAVAGGVHARRAEDDPGAGQPSWFWLGILAATAVGLVVRLWFLAAHGVPDQPGFLVNYDPIFYHRQAQAVAGGKGFLAPYLSGTHPSAGHPPLLVVVLAVASLVGLDSFGAHRLVTVFLGALVVPVVGMLGRRAAGWRVGLVAAGLAAIYPNLWANDGLVMPEGLYALLVAGALWLAWEAWHRVGVAYAIGLGVLIGLAALTRGEGVLLLVFLVLPLVLGAPSFVGASSRVAFALVCGLATLATLLPWTIYNLGRFEHPVLISTAADTTFAGANCDETYFGPGLGFWSTDCFGNISNQQEESVFSDKIRRQAVDYVKGHEKRLPVVVAARVGRVWEAFRPAQNVTSNELQNRPRAVGWAGLWSYLGLLVLAVVGFVDRWRARRPGEASPLWLLVGMVVMVTFTAAAFYGNVRFRIPAELALVVLAAVPLARLTVRGRRSSGGPPVSRARGRGRTTTPAPG